MDQFRKLANMEYAEQLKNPWKSMPQEAKIDIPSDPTPPPPPLKDDTKPVNPIDRELPIDTIVLTPKPAPQPKPVFPIDEVPQNTRPDITKTFYGTPVKVRGAKFSDFRLANLDNVSLSEGWKNLCDTENDNFILDCLQLRDELKLPDWGFFKLVDNLLTEYAPANSDIHTFLMSYVLTQSGYATKLCKASDNHLRLLFGFNGIIFRRNYLKIDGKNFYAYTDLPEGQISIAPVGFKDEKNFSMDIREAPNLKYAPGNNRTLTIHGFPDTKISCTPNKNLIEFYADYPNAALNNVEFTRWTIQGNTPISKELESRIYPVIMDKVKGMNQSQAVNFILKVAQSFDYGYDERIWGYDRTFWAEESWHYPLSDCEDHAINLTRMVRDILGLDAVLIYYPGHLSAGIAITDGSQTGDYVMHDGKKYTICDGTYFYANAGQTAPGNDNSKAVLIPLRR
ncbi:MAG: hypothetical protein K2O47_01660 [Muribaculaceae bacterium]|nr:hypothetical protein [Muribaculaceae bacterium]